MDSVEHACRPQGIMLQILPIMLFRISLKIPHYAHYYSFYGHHCYYYSIAPIIIQCTSVEMRLNYKLCMTILHTLCCIIMKFQWVLYCKIVKSDTHVNEVSLGIFMVFANTEKPSSDDMCIIYKINK